MMRGVLKNSGVLPAQLLIFSLVFMFPIFASALSDAADKMCDVVFQQCPCGQIPNPKPPPKCIGGMNKFQCPPGICKDETNGHVTLGTCTAVQKCKGISSEGKGVDSGLSQLGQMLGQLMQQLMKGGGGDKGGGGEQQQQQQPGMNGQYGCTQYYQTSDISKLSDPCAQYVAPTSGNIDLNSLYGGSSTDNLSESINTNENENTNNNVSNKINSEGGTATSSGGRQLPVLNQGTLSGIGVGTSTEYGDFIFKQNGVTIFVGQRSAEQNTEVAGFFGSQSLGGGQATVTAKLCRNRPWATNFLSKLISASFFDNLCKWRGYQVGIPPAGVQLTQQPVRKSATSTPPVATSTPVAKGRASIWAVPQKVRLGARTTIYWNTQNVTNCTETSADGNFRQNSLSGGAATVPITSATTFTISCLQADGTPVTNVTTVEIAI